MTEQPSDHPQPGKQQIHKLEVPDDMEPAYVNVVRITHSPSELVLDFARMLPGLSPSKVISRLLMSQRNRIHEAFTSSLSLAASNTK